MIETETIGTMRYATDSASAVNLYSTGTASGLTLGQLVKIGRASCRERV